MLAAGAPGAWARLLGGPSALYDVVDVTTHQMDKAVHKFKAHTDPTANFLTDVVAPAGKHKKNQLKKTQKQQSGRRLSGQQCKDASGTCPSGYYMSVSDKELECRGDPCDFSGYDQYTCCTYGTDPNVPKELCKDAKDTCPTGYYMSESDKEQECSGDPCDFSGYDQYTCCTSGTDPSMANCGQNQADMCDAMDSSSTDVKAVIGMVANVSMASAGLAILGVLPSLVGAIAKIKGNEQLENICGGMAILTTFCCGFLLSVALAAGVFMLGGAIGVACDEWTTTLDEHEPTGAGCNKNCYEAIEAVVAGFCNVGSGMSTSAIMCFVTSTFGLLTAVYTCIGFCQKKKQVQPAGGTVVVVQPQVQQQPAGIQMATVVQDDKGVTA
jgi:hypothetical protein